MENYAEQYLNEIRKLVPDTTEETALFSSQISIWAEEYLDEHPNAEYLDFVKSIGDPRKIVDDFLKSEAYVRKPEKSDRLHKEIALLIITLISVVAITVLLYYQNASSQFDYEVPSAYFESNPDLIDSSEGE